MFTLPYKFSEIVEIAKEKVEKVYDSVEEAVKDSYIFNNFVTPVADFIDKLDRVVAWIGEYEQQKFYYACFRLYTLSQQTDKVVKESVDNIVTFIPLTKLVRGVLSATGVIVDNIEEQGFANVSRTVLDIIKKMYADKHLTDEEAEQIMYVAPIIVDEDDNVMTYANEDIVEDIIENSKDEGIYNFEDRFEPVYKNFTVGQVVNIPTTTFTNKTSVIDFIGNQCNQIITYFKSYYPLTMPYNVPYLLAETVWDDCVSLAPSLNNYFNLFTYAVRTNLTRDQQNSITLVVEVFFYPITSSDMTMTIVRTRGGNDGMVTKPCTACRLSYHISRAFPYWFLDRNSGTYLNSNDVMTQAGQYLEVVDDSDIHYIYKLRYDCTFSNLMNKISGGYAGVTPQTGMTLPTSGVIETDYPLWHAKRKEFTTLIDPTDLSNVTTTSYIPVTIDSNPINQDVTMSQPVAQSGIIGTSTTVEPPLEKDIINGSNSTIDTIADPSNPNIPIDINTITLPSNSSPSLPVLPALGGAGMGTIYNPTPTEMESIKGVLWNEDVLRILINIFTNNPLDAIMSSSICFAPPNVAGRKDVKLGYYNTGVESNYVTNQYKEIDCGTITVDEFFNNYMDYEPYTSVGIYLPFIGIRELHANDVIGKSVKVLYRCDVVTGTCVAVISAIKNNVEQILYTFEGNCSVDLPITASSFNLKGMLAGAVTFGLGAYTGSVSTMVQGGMGVLNATPTVGSTGSLGGNAGALIGKIPYIIIKRLQPYNAFNYNAVSGYPTNKTVRLGLCQGFTRVKECHVDGIKCTDEERAMIYESLLSGVIL